MVKAGFDLTRDPAAPDITENRLSRTPHLHLNPRFPTVRRAIEDGPKHFMALMETLGTDDGRALELEALRREGRLTRGIDGVWTLTAGKEA